MKITEKGKTDIEKTLKTRTEIMEYLKKLGGKHVGVYMTLGRYDVVEIVDLPNDEAAIKFAVRAGKTGDVQLETLKAFTEEEMRKATSSV